MATQPYTDPYETYKAANSGQSFADWQRNNALPPAPTPASPASPASPAPPTNGGFASPRPPGATPVAAPGAPAQNPLLPPPPSPMRSAPAGAPVNPFAPTAPSGRATGTALPTAPNGVNIEQLFAQQRGNTDWRDTNVHPDQWGAWEEEERQRMENGTSANLTTPGGCPPDKPFTGRGGQCAYKPDDCPDGQVVQGNDQAGTARCVPGGPGAGGEGGAGGPGGGGGGAGGRGAGGGLFGAGGAGGLSSQVEAALSKLLGDNGTRYTPEVMQGLLSQVKQQTETAGQQGADASREAFASRGMLRSGASAAAEAAARRVGSSQFTGAYSQLLQKKVDADYQDKMAGLNASMQYLEQLRQAALQQNMTALQREQLQAQIKLGYANIQSQMDQLQARAGYNAIGASA